MLLESPFEAARRRACEAGGCPVWQLDDFYTDHWDFDTLCSDFGCAECVADPEDMGPTEPWDPVQDDPLVDIPF